MLRLLLLRSLAMFAVLAIALWVYLPSASTMQRQSLFYLCILVLFLALAQALVIWRKFNLTIQLLCQFGADTLLVSLLVFATGGFHSPFVLLFGLVIVANGIHAHVLSVVLVSVAACAGYLVAIYTYAFMNHEMLPEDATLQLLLQVSILLLVGGIMAAIAKRHAGLARESHLVVREHENLQRMHQQVMSSMSEGMMVLDCFLNIQDYNEAAHHLLNHQGVIGMPIDALHALPKPLISFLQQGGNKKFQCEWVENNKTQLIKACRLPENGKLACWLLTFVDITSIKLLEHQLMEQNKLAAMGRMAAMLAHELRNPMHTMSHAIDLLHKVPTEQQQHIQRIVHEEIVRLNRLISDMLNYTSPLKPERNTCNIAALIAASLAQEDRNQQHHIAVRCDVDKVYEDSGHLRLVIDNLLRNAIQASPTVNTVAIRFQHSSHHDGWVLQIIDQGAGIPDALKESVFEPFASHTTGGTGLGLATVWQVCRANDWNIHHYRNNKQTFFVVTPILQAEKPLDDFIFTAEVPILRHG